MGNGALRYAYPQVQYKVIEQMPYLVGVSEGAGLRGELFLQIRELDIGGKKYAVNQKNIEGKKLEVGITEKSQTYASRRCGWASTRRIIPDMKNPQGLKGKIMENKRPPFEPDTIFHVYNHGNAEDNIFREEENYRYFLKRYGHYIYPVARTYAFCLMPNHFHFMVQIRSREELTVFFQDKDLIGFENLSGLVSKQFSHFLNAYSKAYNKKYNRRGKLFLKSLKRKPAKNDTYYTRLIYYIHQNPVHHGFVEHPQDWPFSSYQIMLSKKKTQLERQQVLDWFGGKDDFVELHHENREIDVSEFY